jgi:hypothetical protein
MTTIDASHRYEIRVKGRIADHWSGWFDGLTIHHPADEETVLSGRLSDQAALFGVLAKIHSLNLKLVSVLRMPAEGGSGAGPAP